MESKTLSQTKKRRRRIEVLHRKEIAEAIRREKDQVVKLKLFVLNLVGNSDLRARDLAEKGGISFRVIYDWLSAWNKEGLDGLRDKRPRASGKPPRLGEEEIGRLRAILEGKPFWTTKEVRWLIKERFNTDLSEDQTRRILRDKLKMTFSKPYPKDYRRSKDAEEILAGNLETVMRLLKEKGLKEEEIAIGFVDESSPQLTANTVRVWSFGKVEIVKNTEKMKSNTIGFYGVRGESISDFLNSSKGEDIAGLLEKIKEANKEYKAIVVVLDNFPSHKSKVVKDKAKGLGIYFVWLPPYSPNLNPIEFLWKSIKSNLSQVD